MGQVQDTALNYFRTALSRTGGHLAELEMEWLSSLGFDQVNINDRWKAFFLAGNTLPSGLEQLITFPSESKFTPAFLDDFSTYADTAALLAVWTQINTTAVTLSSGAMRVENSGAVSGSVRHAALPLKVGATYELQFRILSENITQGRAQVGTTAGGGQRLTLTFAAPGVFSGTFTPSTATTHLSFIVTTPATIGAFFVIDDIRIIRVT